MLTKSKDELRTIVIRIGKTAKEKEIYTNETKTYYMEQTDNKETQGR